LIKMPTEVYQINPGGLTLLGRALAGETIEQIAVSVGAADHPERIRQIHTFFAMCAICWPAGWATPRAGRVPK
jgi:hypothetical protein